jgi:shikimate kinase
MINLKNIIDESVLSQGVFKAIFMSGIPGSGKSYVVNKISDGNIAPRIVNTDKFIEYYSKEVGADINVDPYYDYFRDDIKKLTTKQLALYINAVLPLFVDGTSNSLKSLFRREGILKSFGYDTGMVWINTDVEHAIERAKKRDRNVPEDFIKKVHENLSVNKEYYKSHFKFFFEVNNSEGELTNAAIIKAYKTCSSFFTAPVSNPIGIGNMNILKKSNGYLVPNIYNSLEQIERTLGGWYGNY